MASRAKPAGKNRGRKIGDVKSGTGLLWHPARSRLDELRKRGHIYTSDSAEKGHVDDLLVDSTHEDDGSDGLS
jgi:hypothetical protein